jgi:hypothetical protein
VNNIIIKCLSAVSALAAGTAFAQDLSAGKTPAKLFAADCSACHRSPHGLGKKYNTGSLTGFLRTHYTTTQETAGSLAKYIMASRPVATASPTAMDQTWREPTELVEDLDRTLRGWASYFEAGTRLLDGKHSDLSNGGEKPKPTGKPNARAAAAPQPAAPGVQQIATPAAPQPAVASRLHAYATSGADAEETAADAPKVASGKSHHRARGEAGLTLPPAATGEPAAAEFVTGSTPKPAPIAPEAAEKSSDDMP